MGCGNLYRLWNSHLARKGIIQFAALVLISQVEMAYLPVAGYLRQMDSRVAELSLTERAIAMESAYYYYGAYITADSGAVDAEGAGTGTTEAGTEAEATGVNEAGAEAREGSEIEGVGATEMTALEGLQIQIMDSDEEETPTGIQIQPEVQEEMLREQEAALEAQGQEKQKEQDGLWNESTEIPQEEYFKQMLRENGIEDVDNHLAENESRQNVESGQNSDMDQGAAENGSFSHGATSSGFELAAVPAYTYDWTKQWTEDDLRSEFFAVDGSTSMKEEYLDAERLLNEDLILNNKEETQGPQILIYHTHASEDFVDSIPGDPSTTIVGAGDRLTELLEGYGFRVLHDTGVYDQERDNAYEKALPAVEQILKENPSIEVVIDLHRDEMANDRRLVMDLQGRPTARFMFFNGLSYLRKQGEISYLENPYILDNLAFSFQAQVLANEYYPGLTRKIYLKAYRYNMHLCPKSMLIELGAQNNTVEEIMNACDPLAHVLAMVLKKR